MSAPTIIGDVRLRTIACPKCKAEFPRWYRGTLRVGPTYLTGMRLSGYRRLAVHLEEEHSEEEGES